MMHTRNTPPFFLSFSTISFHSILNVLQYVHELYAEPRPEMRNNNTKKNRYNTINNENDVILQHRFHKTKNPKKNNNK